jgi:hypothetical protein
MMAMMRSRNCAVTISLIGLVLTLASCAYRLPIFAPPSQELIRIVANTPEQYTVQVNTERMDDYDVPHDGRIKVGIPAHRPSCGVYLFNAVKVGGYSDPLKTWGVLISRNGKTVRKLSFRAVQKLATDAAGYHVLRIAD